MKRRQFCDRELIGQKRPKTNVVSVISVAPGIGILEEAGLLQPGMKTAVPESAHRISEATWLPRSRYVIVSLNSSILLGVSAIKQSQSILGNLL